MSGSGSDDSSWDDPPKPLSNGSSGARSKSPPFDETKLVPRTPPRRSTTMIGLGAVKPGSPLPSPLHGLSSAMARGPADARGAKGHSPSPVPPPQSTPMAPAPAPLAAPAPLPAPAPVLVATPAVDVPPATPAVVSSSSTRAAHVEDEVDDEGLSKAYLAPTSVPKAMLPSNEDDAKVVINIPTPAATSNEEVTATIDREALERQRVRDEQLDAQRRREPTQRIPRKAVQEARREIEERTAREAALEAGVDPADVVVDSIRAIPSGPPIAGEDVTPAPKSSSRPPAARVVDAPVATSQVQPSIDSDGDDVQPTPAAERPNRSLLYVAMAAVVAMAGVGAFFLFGKGSAPANSPSQTETAQPAAKTQTTAKPGGATAAPPLELTADPKSNSPDPNVVHLDAQAADTPSPTAEPTTQPIAPVAPLPQRLPAVKPASTYYTPSDI